MQPVAVGEREGVGVAGDEASAFAELEGVGADTRSELQEEVLEGPVAAKRNGNARMAAVGEWHSRGAVVAHRGLDVQHCAVKSEYDGEGEVEGVLGAGGVVALKGEGGA